MKIDSLDDFKTFLKSLAYSMADDWKADLINTRALEWHYLGYEYLGSIKKTVDTIPMVVEIGYKKNGNKIGLKSLYNVYYSLNRPQEKCFKQLNLCIDNRSFSNIAKLIKSRVVSDKQNQSYKETVRAELEDKAKAERKLADENMQLDCLKKLVNLEYVNWDNMHRVLDLNADVRMRFSSNNDSRLEICHLSMTQLIKIFSILKESEQNV